MTWVSIQSLPVPLAQSTSVAWNDQLLCLGGLTESGHTDEVLLLGWNDQELTIGELPSMPGTAAWPSGTLDKSVVYVAGGLQSASDTVATHNFWALDLAGTPPGVGSAARLARTAPVCSLLCFHARHRLPVWRDSVAGSRWQRAARAQ